MVTFPAGRVGRRSAVCQLAVGLAWAALVFCVVYPGLIGGPGDRWALCAVTVASAVSCLTRAWTSRHARAAWVCLGVGLAGYAAGFVILFFAPPPLRLVLFGVNLSDALSLVLYPAGYAGLLLLANASGVWRDRSAFLEGTIVLLVSASVACSWVGRTFPDLAGRDPWRLLYALAYPVGGFTLLCAALLGMASSRRRIDMQWALLVMGLAAMTAGDSAYGVQVVTGTFHFGSSVDLLFTAGPALVSAAAWAGLREDPAGTRSARAERLVTAVPAGATVLGIGILVRAHFTPETTAVVVFAAAAAIVSVFRTALFTQQERQLVRARLQAETDDLTGLGNRRALTKELAVWLMKAEVATETVLLLADLDGFKAVNDALGSSAGDRLLQALADRLRNGAGDTLVFRLDGDKFAFLLAGDQADARAYARVVAGAAAEPFLLDEVQASVGVSSGFVVVPPDGPAVTADEVLRRADVALYRAKELRDGHPEEWTPATDTAVMQRVQVVSELRVALGYESNQIVAYFQPQYAVQGRRLAGFEALVRWEHPTRGLLFPGSFLEPCERAGLLPALTLRVLRAALTHVARLAQEGCSVPVSVNVGVGDLLDPGFAKTISDLLWEAGVPASSLCVEVTETVVMSDPVAIMTTLESLRAFGVRIALDDYGTGLASLAYLRSLPVDELKIDRSFVSDLITDPAAAVIVASTINLAHALGLSVVAEGVEDEPGFAALTAIGCDTVQGYLMGRPEPANVSFARALKDQRSVVWRSRSAGSVPAGSVPAGSVPAGSIPAGPVPGAPYRFGYP